METATQTLRRLTSFEPGQTGAVAMTPRVRNDFASNDLDRLPYFYKRYPPGPGARPAHNDLLVQGLGKSPGAPAPATRSAWRRLKLRGTATLAAWDHRCRSGGDEAGQLVGDDPGGRG